METLIASIQKQDFKNINTMKIFIAYLIVAEIYESIHFIIGYRKLIKYKNGNETIKEFILILLSSANMKMLFRRILNPFTIAFVGIPLVLIINLFIFPFSIFYLIRKALGIKSRLQIEAEKETEKIIQSERRPRRRSNDFMKTETMHIDLSEPINPN